MLETFLENPCTPEALQLGLILLTLTITMAVSKFQKRHGLSKYPVINDKRRWELSYTNANKRFAANAKDLIEEGFAEVSGKEDLESVRPSILGWKDNG